MHQPVVWWITAGSLLAKGISSHLKVTWALVDVKPQQKQPRQLSASILAWIVSQCVQLSFDGEKCVVLLCTWKPAFLKSVHIYCIAENISKRKYWKFSYLDYWGRKLWWMAINSPSFPKIFPHQHFYYMVLIISFDLR